MSDFERLDEALEQYARPVPGEPGWYMLPLDVVDARTVAARAYRDLLANGERVEWCEEHRHEGFDSEHEPGWVCESGEWVEDEGRWDCSVVSRLLVDPPKEEERWTD